MSSSKAAGLIERKSTESLKGSCISKKPEELRQMNNRFGTALDSNTYRLLEISSLYDDQVLAHVAKWVSRSKVQMAAQTFDLMAPIQIIGFLHTFKMAYGNEGLQKGSSTCVVQLMHSTQ